jgi:hypothetical protein
MKFLATVHTPMYDHNEKKYIRLVIPENCAEIVRRNHINKSRFIKNYHIDNPLEGRILTVKVPFRYRRVMCVVKGCPVQSLIKDDEIEVEVDFTGVWNVGNYSGYTWKLISINSLR